MGQMNTLFQYSHQNQSLPPYVALDQYIANIASQDAAPRPNTSEQGMLSSPNMDQFPTWQSPSTAHLVLPGNATRSNLALGYLQTRQMTLQQSQRGISSNDTSADARMKVSSESWTKGTITGQSSSFGNSATVSRLWELSRDGSRLSSSQPEFVAASTVEEETATPTPALDADWSYLLSLIDDGEEDVQHMAEMLFDGDGDDEDYEEYGSDGPDGYLPPHVEGAMQFRAPHARANIRRRAAQDRTRLEKYHPELLTMWTDLEKLPAIKTVRAEQPKRISRELKPFQLEGL